jgi:catechol 2,3-dioxygenase-like lactoylglutathione lyase family enzyme
MNITEVQLLTDNLDKTRHFYHEILGLEILSSGNGFTSFSAGLSVLTFHKAGNNRPVYHFAFNIPNNKFEEAMDWAGSKLDLVKITPSNCIADFKSWNAKAFYFYDNNKNIVEMIARFDLDNSSQQSFDGSSVYSISEIGAVVENPKQYAQVLLANYNLHFFSRQEPVNDFIAVGDDEGLFIIVTENRIWYPTNIRSARHWAKVTLQLTGRIAEITL